MSGIILFYHPDRAHGFLSNFFDRPLVLHSYACKTSEHGYQALKSDEELVRQKVLAASTPAKSKHLGQEVRLRSGWMDPVPDHAFIGTPGEDVIERLKDLVMYQVVLAKFTQNKDCRSMLLFTSDARLIENAPKDYYWGNGADGTGKNKLGVILMAVRKYLRSVPEEYIYRGA